MSFTDQKPFTATEEQCNFPWGGGKPGENFRCGFCGYRFKPGDTVRWQYTNDTKGAHGNPLVCADCDDTPEELIARWKAKWDLVRSSEMWWFYRDRG
jgi:hypothetical protein